jgi:hypothetical protein
MKLVSKLLAPYVAVGVFWCVLSNAWLAIVSYHALILLWSWRSIPHVWTRPRWRETWLGAPAILAGPLLYFLLPHIARADLSVWLAAHHLSGTALLVMIPYFGLVHPPLEQLHWAPLRERTPAAHVFFAGYHPLVLASLLPIGWLAACFVILAGASVAWERMVRRSGSLAPALVSQLLADLGIVLAAWWRVHG